MEEKKFKFDAERSEQVRSALEKLKNQTLQSIAAEFVGGTAWSKFGSSTAFSSCGCSA